MTDIRALSNKYELAAQRIQQWITDQQLQVDDKILSQNQFAQILEMHPLTVNKAMNLLVQQGVLYRVQGKGTFVRRQVSKTQALHIAMLTIGEGLDNPLEYPNTWHLVNRLRLSLLRNLNVNDHVSSVIMSADQDPDQAIERLKGFHAVFVHQQPEWNDTLYVDLAHRLPVPLVMINHRLPSLPCLSASCDRLESVRRATHWLFDQGHHRIAYFGTDEDSSHLKYAGFEQAHREAGLAIEPSLVHLNITMQAQGIQAAGLWLANQARWKTQAVFLDTDLKAASFVHELLLAGVSVGTDVAVVGYDGLREFCEQPPYLTSIHVPIDQMVQAALQEIHACDPSRSTTKCIDYVGELVVGRTALPRQS